MKYKMKILLDQLVDFEGLVLKVYQDHLGIDTIGIGRNLIDRGISDKELELMGKTIEEVYAEGITKEDAYMLAANDIKIVEAELCYHQPCIEDLGEARQRVLIDMAFNMGVPRLLKFEKMWSAIHKGSYNTASKEMLDSKWALQVKKRAIKLSSCMQSGDW